MNDDTYEPASGDPDRRAGHEPDGTAAATDGENGANRTDSDSRTDDSNSPADDSPHTDDSDRNSSDVMNEDALRRLLHGAVDELQPSADSLEHLRRAVPARRTRRRQALVGAVAAVVLGGAALPALVHVARSGGSDARPEMAGSSRRTPDPGHDKHGEGSGGKETSPPSGKGSEDKGDKGEDGKKDHPTKKPQDDSGGVAPDPSSTLNATSPTCSRPQLGNASGTAGVADAEGRIYGSFRVVNISGTPCTVVGGGSISPSAVGGADSSRIFVVDHTSGDAATGLPDPSTAPGQLILKPGQAYEVQFAWIPQSGGGTSGCSNTSTTPTPDPTPDSADGADGGPTDGPGDGSGSGSGGGGGDGGEQPAGSVLLSYTPEAGEPAAASVTLSGACAGTIYRTGVLVGA
ncbi:hypothetical protein AB4Z54_04885 [Streptomyces sp. MCAF7]